mgnify:FL=1|tara:strand:+ start:402 stop:674 length:273 start_codon:yes stop_codon:yes gene_type:complete
MGTEKVEHNELIAQRVPPGDRWSLVGDPKKEVFKTLTDALEAFLQQTGFKGAYRLDPLDSKLYAIQVQEYEVKKEEPKMYSLYGEFKQGI